jgi:hypothetical protein
MARHRTRVRVSRSLRAVAVALAAAGSVTALFEADMGRAILLSSSTVALVPPALYLLLGLVLLRGAPLGRQLGWALAACGVNVILALASGVTLSLTHPMSFEGAMRRALWAFAPGPLIHLVAAPLVLLAWRSRVVPLRVTMRPESGRSSRLTRLPAPPLAASTPDWDSVLRAPTPPARSASPAAAVERGARERRIEPEPKPPRRSEAGPMPVVAAAPAPAASAAPPLVALPSPAPASIAAPPVVALPSPARAPAPAVAATAVMTPPPVATPATVVTPASSPPVIATPEPPSVEEPVIRVPFDRIADQLPPDVFVLPPERLAESVREPHVIVIPCRLVLPQLGEGAVEISWTLVDDQFPELALAMPRLEVRRRFPGWVLSLPMDEVVRQLPREVFRVQAPAADLFDIAQFPAPFTPEPPAPPEAPLAEGMPEAEPLALVEPEAPSAPAATAIAEGPTLLEDEDPAVDCASSEPPPAPHVAVGSPAPLLDPVDTASQPASVAADEESETLGRTLALGLAPLGAFDWQARRVGGRPLLSFVPPAIPRGPIDALAAAAAPLVDRLASWGVEQVTIRTTRLVCVLTPLGSHGCLAATVRRGGAVAMLELLSTRVGRVTGDTAGVASAAIAFPTVATTPAGTANGHRAVGEAARALAVFGPPALSVAEAEGAAPSVYVFGGQDQAVLAGAARAVHETLVAGHDHDALGRLESIVLRRGRERVVVRPLRRPSGQPAVLAAAGDVALAGRAHRAVAQAAALLEAR